MSQVNTQLVIFENHLKTYRGLFKRSLILNSIFQRTPFRIKYCELYLNYLITQILHVFLPNFLLWTADIHRNSHWKGIIRCQGISRCLTRKKDISEFNNILLKLYLDIGPFYSMCCHWFFTLKVRKLARVKTEIS